MKKIIFFVVLLLSLFIINNFVQSIYSLWQKQDLITKAKKDLRVAKQEQQKLQQALREAQEPTFFEKESRNKLFLVRPGEQVIVLPGPSGTTQQKQLVVKPHLPAWKQWYALFFE